jgi:hypothetical protein
MEINCIAHKVNGFGGSADVVKRKHSYRADAMSRAIAVQSIMRYSNSMLCGVQ